LETVVMAKNFPLNPRHPERICWGCDRYCPAQSLACGNGSGRVMHRPKHRANTGSRTGASSPRRRIRAWRCC